jgi:putative membrane protein
MDVEHYVKNDPRKMVLRDHLAFDRTVLANQRTCLAHLRFGIFSLATGLTFMKVFADDRVFLMIAYLAIALSVVAVVVGTMKFYIFRKKLNMVYKPFGKN